MTYTYLEYDDREDRLFVDHVNTHDEPNWLRHLGYCSYCYDRVRAETMPS